MWADRDVRRVVIARFVSRVGGEAAFFVGIWGKAAFDLDATSGQLAAVMAALGIASLIGASVSGVLVDRYDPRRVLIVGEIVFIPAALAMILANDIPTLVVTTFVLGLVATPVFTAIASFAPFLTDDEARLARINGAIEGASWAAFVAGPAVGALLAGWVGINAIFVLDAATSAVAAAAVIPVTVRHMERTRERRKTLQELRDGFTYTYAHDRLRFYIWVGSAVWILFGTFSALEPLFYRDILGAEVETMGWVASIFGIGLVSGTWIAARLPERLRSARFLTVVVGLNAFGVVAYIGTDQIRVVVAAAVVWGVLIGVMAPLHRTLIQINSPDDYVGRIMSVNHVHSETGHLIPLAIAPTLAGAFGVQPTLLMSGGLVAIIALLFWKPATRLDRTRVVAVPRPGLPDPSDEPRSVGH